MDDEQVNEAITCLKQKDALPEDLEHSIKYLAQRSKSEAAVRRILAHRHVLEALVELFEKDVDENWALIDAALRCIANACADNDDARAIIAELGFAWTSKCLYSGRPEALALVTPVIYNIINDFEPAQKECCEYGIFHSLLENWDIGPGEVDQNLISSVLDVLFLITAHLPAGDMGIDKSLTPKEMKTLFALPLHCIAAEDVDAVAMSIEVVQPFLKDTCVQLQTLHRDELPRVWEILERLDWFAAQLESQGPDSVEDVRIIIPLCSSLTWCVSDIAALPEFAMELHISHSFIEQLLACIDIAGQIEVRDVSPSVIMPTRVMLNAACQMIGNWLWNLIGLKSRFPTTTKPEELATLVEQRGLHRAVFSAILLPAVPGKTSDLLHSAAGLLIHLTRSSPKGQEIIGSDVDAVRALEILCRHPMNEVKIEGVRLLKALCIGNNENQKRFEALAAEVMAISRALEQVEP